jgi:hypothetical protein
VVDPEILKGRKANPVGKKPLYKNAVTGNIKSISKIQKLKGQDYKENKKYSLPKIYRESKLNVGWYLAYRTIGRIKSKRTKISSLYSNAY